MKKFLLFIALGLTLTAMTIACKSKPKLLTEEQMLQKIDSMYNTQIETLGADLDDACDAKFDDLVQTALDSILAARTEVN